jgi:lysozyme family protein
VTPNEIIDGILVREGGFVDHSADKGGPTKYGITQATLADWRGKPVSAEDVRTLTENEAREIYREAYITRPGFLGIENGAIRALAVDCAVNHGVKRAVQLLQEAAHVFTDGVFGPNTRDAVNRMTAAVLYRRLCAARVRLYGQIITKNPTQAVFAAGWANRVAEFIEGSV